MRRTSARVPAERLAAGDLPAVCVVSGRPADTRVRMTFRWTPDWTWLLLLFGIIPFFIAAHFATVAIPATLPVARDTLSRYRAQRRGVWLGLIAGVALLVAAAVAQLPALAWLGLVGVITAAAGLVVANLWWVGAAPGRHLGDVTLRRVHPNFARGLHVDDASEVESPTHR